MDRRTSRWFLPKYSATFCELVTGWWSTISTDGERAGADMGHLFERLLVVFQNGWMPGASNRKETAGLFPRRVLYIAARPAGLDGLGMKRRRDKKIPDLSRGRALFEELLAPFGKSVNRGDGEVKGGNAKLMGVNLPFVSGAPEYRPG